MLLVVALHGSVSLLPQVHATRQTTELDPTAQVLLTVFGAAIVTALAGFAGAAIQGRREHRRWVRQQRLAAYVLFLQFAHGLWDIVDDQERMRSKVDDLKARIIAVHDDLGHLTTSAEGDALRAMLEQFDRELDKVLTQLHETDTRAHDVRDSMIESSVACFLLGPKRVADAAGRLAESTSVSAELIRSRIEEMEAAMRQAIGVGG